MRAKKLCALLLALSMTILLCSCWEEDEGDEFWNETLPGEQEDEIVETRISSFALPYLQNQTFDPVTCIDGIQQAIGALLYEGLFALDEGFLPQKVLCSNYTYDAQKRTYTFYVRDDATFSDGSPLSASDVLAVYRRAAASERYGTRFDNVSSMLLSGNALVITLKQENSAFPALLDIPIVKDGSEKDLVPLGTGPYLFLTNNGSTCLIKNTDWWRAADFPIERIALVSARDNGTASYLISSYDAHLLVSDLTGTATTGSVGEVDVFDADSTAMLYLGFNTRRTILSESSVRHAMSNSIHRDTIVSALLSGHARAAQFPISPAAALYPSGSFASGTDYAQALSDAGVSSKHPKTLTLLVNRESSFKLSVAEALCRELSADALSITLKALPWEDYLLALQTGNFDLYLGETKLTADWNAAPLISTAGALNYGGYADDEADRLLGAFLANETQSTAQAYFQHFEQTAPIAPSAFKSVSTQISAGLVENACPTAANPFYNFDQWTLHLEQ